MINEFIEKTIGLLEMSDIVIHKPQHRVVRIDGGQVKRYINLVDSNCTISLKDNLILHNTIFFSIIDSFIDVDQPELEGRSFAGKYKGLDMSRDKGIMLKQIYRILRMLRNASVHSKNAISVDGDDVRIEYSFRNTDFKLVMGKRCLELVYSFVLIVIEQHNSSMYPSKYCAGLLRAIYDDVRGGIAVFKDDLECNNPDLSDGLRLSYGVRDKVMDPKHEIDKVNQKLIVERLKLSDIERATSAPDYHLQVNGKTYFIPEKCLDNEGAITLADLPDWEVPCEI